MTDYAHYLPRNQYQGCVVSGAGDVAYVGRSGGNYELYVHQYGADQPTRLTDWDDQSVNELCWHPDGQRVFFTADHLGSEKFHIYEANVASGTVTQITGGEPQYTGGLAAGWSPDGRYLAYATDAPSVDDMNASQAIPDKESPGQPDPDQADPGQSDAGQADADSASAGGIAVWVYDVTDGSHRRVVEHQGVMLPEAWSGCSTLLGVMITLADDHRIPGVLNAATGEQVSLGKHGDGITTPLDVRAEDDIIALSNTNAEFSRVVTDNLAGKANDVAANDQWDIEYAAVAGADPVLVWAVNNAGFSELSAMRLATQDPVPLGDLPAGVIDSFHLSSNGTHLVVHHSAPGLVPQLYLLGVEDGSVRQLTDNVAPGRRPGQTRCDSVSYPSVPGVQVPAYVYQPTVDSPYGDGTYPVVVSLHGGPTMQEKPNYTAFFEMLLAHGIGVVAPNVRGSTGYGVAYMSAILGNWGVVDLQDLAATHQYVSSLPWVNADRMGLYGRSYGGFLCLSGVTRQPDLWACGVDLVGPSNLITFDEAMPDWWRQSAENFIGDIKNDRDGVIARSPISHVENVTAPLMVVQGANDPIVPRAESDQLVAELRDRDIPVSYEVYPNEGHMFSQESNEIDCYNKVLAFLTRHLTKL